VSANTGPRNGERGEAADLGTHTENNDGTTLAANTAVDTRGGSPQGAHLSGAATPRPPRGRRRQNQNGLDTTQVSGRVLSSWELDPCSSARTATFPSHIRAVLETAGRLDVNFDGARKKSRCTKRKQTSADERAVLTQQWRARLIGISYLYFSSPRARRRGGEGSGRREASRERGICRTNFSRDLRRRFFLVEWSV